MDREALRRQAEQLHQDTGALAAVATRDVGIGSAIAVQYNALRAQVASILGEQNLTTLPPAIKEGSGMSLTLVEVYLFSGQLLGLLGERPARSAVSRQG